VFIYRKRNRSRTALVDDDAGKGGGGSGGAAGTHTNAGAAAAQAEARAAREGETWQVGRVVASAPPRSVAQRRAASRRAFSLVPYLPTATLAAPRSAPPHRPRPRPSSPSPLLSPSSSAPRFARSLASSLPSRRVLACLHPTGGRREGRGGGGRCARLARKGHVAVVALA
jgi:hypothetical protein